MLLFVAVAPGLSGECVPSLHQAQETCPMKLMVSFGALALTVMPAAAQSDLTLFAPDNPQLHGQGPRYTSVTGGLKRFNVVEPKNWIELNRAVGPQGGGENAAAAAASGKHEGDAR